VAERPWGFKSPLSHQAPPERETRSVSIDSATYRKVMGTFATGVTVVTTALDGRLHGFTANAVASLSLDPLLLLVCVDKRAQAHGELAKAHAFAVNVLAADQEGTSNIFAASGEPMIGSLRGMPFRLGATGSPLLDGALAHLECETYRALDGGDHTIHLGRVVRAEVVREAGALLDYRGKYRTLI
jgi:flavin reductase (DIM6/NTAB) family NADH-FMN oxidoreductase RutF